MDVQLVEARRAIMFLRSLSTDCDDVTRDIPRRRSTNEIDESRPHVTSTSCNPPFTYVTHIRLSAHLT